MIGVVMVVMVTVATAVVLMRRMGVVITAIVQQQCAKQIHEKPDRSQRYSLVEGDWDGVDQPPDTLIPDQKGDHRQHEGARKRGKIAELTGTENETLVSGMAAGVGVGKGGDHERACMGRHVQPIRDECHRSPQQTADDFRSHHRAAQGDHSPTAPLVSRVIPPEKHVFVTPRVERVRVHC
jgi:hypothetical protein